MIYKLSCILILYFFLVAMLTTAEPVTWRVSEDGIYVRIAKGLNPRDPSIAEEYQLGRSEKWGPHPYGPNIRMLSASGLAPLFLSGRDLASAGDPIYMAQRMWEKHSQDSVLARLRGENHAEDDDRPQPLKDFEQLLALRIAMDHEWQAALPVCEQLLKSEDPFLQRAAQQAIAILAESPHDSGSPPSLPPLDAAVASLPNDSFFIIQVDSRQAPRWRNPQHNMRQVMEFTEIAKYLVTGGQISPAMIGYSLLVLEESTALPTILAARYGNIRIDRTLLSLSPSQSPQALPVGFHLLIEGAFTRDQMIAIATDSNAKVRNDRIDLGFMQIDIADRQLRIFSTGADQGDGGPDWFDAAAASDTFVSAATHPAAIQTLAQFMDPLPPQLAGLNDAILQIHTDGADIRISSTLDFTTQGIAESLSQLLSMAEINQPEQLEAGGKRQGISLVTSTRLLEFLKPIWAKREIQTEGDTLTINLTWPAADLGDLLNAASQLRPAWEQEQIQMGTIFSFKEIVNRIMSQQTALEEKAKK